jgi:Protein of unknown function (DUF4232)
MRRLLVLAVAAGLATLGLSSGAQGAGGGPRCHAADLAGALIDIQGGAGSEFDRLIIVNKSSHTCHLRGFIGAQFNDRHNHPLPTHVTRDHATPVTTVVLPSGGAAAAQLRWSLVASGTTACPKPRWLRVTPPGATKSFRVHFGRTACRGDLTVRALTNPTTVG